MADANVAGSYAVIVVGAGPAGLALAIELGTRGISCLLVERQERGGHAPRCLVPDCDGTV